MGTFCSLEKGKYFLVGSPFQSRLKNSPHFTRHCCSRTGEHGNATARRGRYVRILGPAFFFLHHFWAFLLLGLFEGWCCQRLGRRLVDGAHQEGTASAALGGGRRRPAAATAECSAGCGKAWADTAAKVGQATKRMEIKVWFVNQNLLVY